MYLGKVEHARRVHAQQRSGPPKIFGDTRRVVAGSNGEIQRRKSALGHASLPGEEGVAKAGSREKRALMVACRTS